MIDHLSHSSIAQFLRCSWQWKLQRIDKIPNGVSWSMLAGSILHEVAEWNFLNKVEGGKDLSLSKLQEHAKKIGRIKIDETPLWHIAADESKDDALESLWSRVDVCVNLFAQFVAPAIRPIEGGIEKKVIIPAGQGFPKIICILDCIDAAGRLHDFKTTGKSPSAEDLHHDDQPSAYGLAYRLEYGADPAGFTFHYLIEKSKPESLPVETARKAEHYVAFLRKAQQVWAAHSAGLYLPAPRGWWCSEEHCWYAKKGTCEFFVKTV